jgi:hypothetical protein
MTIRLNTTREERATHLARSAMAETATVPASLIYGIITDYNALLDALIKRTRELADATAASPGCVISDLRRLRAEAADLERLR